ncbi:GNAT family N-acetyltransferase [Methylobacterium sp. A49B]
MDESVAVRRGEPSDAKAIQELVAAAYTKWIPVIGRLPIPMQADYAQAVLEDRFDLLIAGPDLAGLIETKFEAAHLLVVNVAVHPAFQGRGFGTRLLGQAEAIAAEAGLDRLRLYTHRAYTANLRLYGSLGYRVEREERYAGPGRIRDDDVTVHMVKDLATDMAERRPA